MSDDRPVLFLLPPNQFIPLSAIPKLGHVVLIGENAALVGLPMMRPISVCQNDDVGPRVSAPITFRLPSGPNFLTYSHETAPAIASDGSASG